MADYKEMYIRMFQAATQAIEILQKAQQDCEELYISAPEPELTVFPGRPSETER
ncbi:MAG: hypothetical protein HDT37_06165 [Clostridiales bacterium]|nr:hypothetical protein [Clostridiales bacterium]